HIFPHELTVTVQKAEDTWLAGLGASESSQVYAPASPYVSASLRSVAAVCPKTGAPLFSRA
ncbi:hypothetical protein Q2356_24640, partial [Escherichia coli]|nr:hypothetical protein [Escherichia coli]